MLTNFNGRYTAQLDRTAVEVLDAVIWFIIIS